LFDHKGLVKALLPQELRQAATPVNNSPSPIDLDMLSEKVLDYAVEVGAEDAGIVEEEVEEEAPQDSSKSAPSQSSGHKLDLLAWFQCNPDDVNHVRTRVAAQGFKVVFAEAVFTPLSRVVIEDEKNAALITKFLEMVGEHEDVVKVHDNIDWDPDSS
jgi:transcriptional/translational regulatory protein YebC/TACO1